MTDDIRRLRALATSGDSEATRRLEAIERRSQYIPVPVGGRFIAQGRRMGSTLLGASLIPMHVDHGWSSSHTPRIKRYRKPRYRLR